MIGLSRLSVLIEPARTCNSAPSTSIFINLTLPRFIVCITESSVSVLYRVPEILTLGRFPDARESDSTWRTQEVRHVGSDTIAPRLWCVPAAWFGEEDERRPSGPSASGARRNL